MSICAVIIIIIMATWSGLTHDIFKMHISYFPQNSTHTLNTNAHTHMDTHSVTHTHTCMHAHTHTHMHTHAHTHICLSLTHTTESYIRAAM